jgi:YfiH family protein
MIISGKSAGKSEMTQFSLRSTNGLSWIVCEPIEGAGFRNAFSTRQGGVSNLPVASLSLGNFVQDSRDAVLENRRRFRTAIGASEWPLITVRQVHSADVCLVLDKFEFEREPPTCDAMVSDLENTLLAVQTADCIPILIADPRTRAFAAVHAGWRGTLKGIVARTIERMQQEFHARPEDLLIAVGPAIGSCCFEVGMDVVELFSGEFKYAGELMAPNGREGKVQLDLNLANFKQLVAIGVEPDKIYDSRLCTSCRKDLFFSYRRDRGRENPVGRLMGVIGRDTRNL